MAPQPKKYSLITQRSTSLILHGKKEAHALSPVLLPPAPVSHLQVSQRENKGLCLILIKLVNEGEERI